MNLLAAIARYAWTTATGLAMVIAVVVLLPFGLAGALLWALVVRLHEVGKDGL